MTLPHLEAGQEMYEDCVHLCVCGCVCVRVCVSVGVNVSALLLWESVRMCVVFFVHRACVGGSS